MSRLRPHSRAAWAAWVGFAGYLLAYALGRGFLQTVFFYIFVGALIVLSWRALGSVRKMLLWRLRNRLIVTYFFIAIIPILLIVGMVGLTGYLLYGQLAGYLIASDLEQIAAQLGAVNRNLATKVGSMGSGRTVDEAQFLERLEQELEQLDVGFSSLQAVLTGPGVDVRLPLDIEDKVCGASPAWTQDEFAGMVVTGGTLYVHSAQPVPGRRATLLCLTAEVDSALLTQAGEGIGVFELTVVTEGKGPAGGLQVGIRDRQFTSTKLIKQEARALPPPAYFFDPVLLFYSKFDAAMWDSESDTPIEIPVFISVTTRASLLNSRVFAPLGDVGAAYIIVLFVIAVLFLVVQFVAMITGFRLTRSITFAVHELYASTVKLQAGDFTARVKTRREDQLGALCDSFNQMASSIEDLIEQSRQKQRLENEVEIARQVQEQLFPRKVPILNTLTLAGRCLPASGVSGDYFDYGLTRPGNLVFTLGDISGKGVSAALLMASIQSMIRGQIDASRAAGELEGLGVAELVSRVNRLLCLNTAPEKYSTLFVAHYDDATRRLTYTNAGHLPPLLVRGGTTQELSVGGAVVGLFPDIEYEEAVITLEEEDCLVAYTDGVTEIENSYEEDYGIPRLAELLRRHSAEQNPDRLIDHVFDELEQWAPGAEPADDRTILVVRCRPGVDGTGSFG